MKDRDAPKRTTPIIDIDDPRRLQLRSDKVLPTQAASKSDIDEPNFALCLPSKDNEDPKRA
jgi:hypothetical protein